jgi:hypothetical protein
MVAGVQQAQPTPYKKRTVQRKNNEEEDDSDTKRKVDNHVKKKDSDNKPYDSSKLRQKYNIEEGDTAPIWWESKGLTLEKSKFVPALF